MSLNLTLNESRRLEKPEALVAHAVARTRSFAALPGLRFHPKATALTSQLRLPLKSRRTLTTIIAMGTTNQIQLMTTPK